MLKDIAHLLTLQVSFHSPLGYHLTSFNMQETIRMLMSIGGLVPLPSDALVTPVTFRVRKHNLPGILADLDAMEDGERVLRGEWVVGRKTWQRMQTEWKAAHVSTPGSPQLSSDFSSWDIDSGLSKVGSRKKERVVLYIHGGAFSHLVDQQACC